MCVCINTKELFFCRFCIISTYSLYFNLRLNGLLRLHMLLIQSVPFIEIDKPPEAILTDLIVNAAYVVSPPLKAYFT